MILECGIFLLICRTLRYATFSAGKGKHRSNLYYIKDIISNKTEIFNRKTKYMERCKKIVTHKKRMMRKIKNERKGYAVKKSSKKKGTI